MQLYIQYHSIRVELCYFYVSFFLGDNCEFIYFIFYVHFIQNYISH